MRKRLILTLALGAAAGPSASRRSPPRSPTRFRAGNLILTADGGVTPKALPKNKFAPISLNVSGKIATTDGTHPSAFREAIVDIDKNGAINTKGLPACTSGQLAGARHHSREAGLRQRDRRLGQSARSRSPSPNRNRSTSTAR